MKTHVENWQIYETGLSYFFFMVLALCEILSIVAAYGAEFMKP